MEGKISSTFGWRNPTNPNVPRNHTGLDLAAPTGTVIKSATDGVVTMVSSAGDYGKHYRIQNDDITIDRIKPGSKYPYHIRGKYGEIGWTDVIPKTKKKY